MTDLSTDLGQGEAFELSTQLDEGRPAEASQHKEPATDEKKPTETRLDAIKRAAADVEKANPKPDDKAAEKVEPKADDKPDDGKDAKPVDGERPAAEAKPEGEKKAETEARQRRQPIEPPAKFLPRAKELWPNTPHEVRSEMQRVISEAEAESTQARESVKEYEAIRPYAEMAKQSGTTIDQALGRFVQMEQTLRTDPAQGFRALLGNMQMGPQQAIGAIMAAFNVAPERLAQHMAQSPNEYTALAQPQRQQQAPQPQANGEVESLKQQVARMQQTIEADRVRQAIIAPFAAENPRYYELEGTIVEFLKSDMIPKSLSPNDRLAAAYDMAVRISPSARAAPASIVPDGEGEKTDSRAGDDFGGTKSVRGAPATGVDTSSRRRGKMSRGDAISAAFAELGLAS